MYPTTSKQGSVNQKIKKLLDFLSFCDGKNSILQIQNYTNLSVVEVREIMKKLIKHKLIDNRKSPL